MKNQVQKLVVVVTGVKSTTVLERWVFNIEQEEKNNDNDNENNTSSNSSHKSIKEITAEIQAIVRQITASVTFLPLLNEQCSFDLLVYTNQETNVPQAWAESDPLFIPNSTQVRLRSFTTKVHKVDTMVDYKNPEE